MFSELDPRENVKKSEIGRISKTDEEFKIPIRLPLLKEQNAHIVIRVPILPDGMGDAGQAVNIGKLLLNENPNRIIDIFLFVMPQNIHSVEKLIEGVSKGYPNLNFHVIESNSVKYKLYGVKWEYDNPEEAKMDGPKVFLNDNIKKVLNEPSRSNMVRIVIDVPVPYISYEKDNLSLWGGGNRFLQLSEYGSAPRVSLYERRANYSLKYNFPNRKEDLFKPLGLPLENDNSFGIIIMPMEDDLKISDISNNLIRDFLFNNIEKYRKNNLLSTCYTRSPYTQLNQMLCLSELAKDKSSAKVIDIVLPNLLIDFKNPEVLKSLGQSNISKITLIDENINEKELYINSKVSSSDRVEVRFIQPGFMRQNDMRTLQNESLKGIKERDDVCLFSVSGDGSITDVLSMAFENSRDKKGVVLPIWEHRMEFHRNSIKSMIELQRKVINNPLLDELLKKLFSYDNDQNLIQSNILSSKQIKRIKELALNKSVSNDFLTFVKYIQQNHNAGQLGWLINDIVKGTHHKIT